MTWFYESNGAQKGPISESELDRLILEGQIQPTTLVWREGQAAWAPLQQARPGGPVPASPAAAGTAQCASCGRFFDPGDLVELGGHRICAGCKPSVLQRLQQGGALPELVDPNRTGPAWEHRETLGWFEAGKQTVVAVLTAPTQTFATMRLVGGLTNPFYFAMLMCGLGSVVLTIYIEAAKFYFGSSLTTPGVVNPFLTNNAFSAITLVMNVISALVGAAVGTFINSAVLHLCLMLCGGARRNFEATYRACCYGAGSVALLHIVPGLGSLVAIPWGLVVTAIGLQKAHDTDLWRAVVAIFLPMIVCCGLMILFILAIAGMVSAAAAHS